MSPEVDAVPSTSTPSAAAARLLDLLQAWRGIVCLVGAGGKKTTMQRLAAAHPGRIAITTTVRIPPLPGSLGAEALSLAPDALGAAVAARAETARVVAYTGVPVEGDRLAGVPADVIAALHARCGFAATFVKADGARMRRLKAPGADEPVLVPGAATVLPVVSVRALGRPLDGRVAHRPERIGAIVGLTPGGTIESEHLGALLASEEGALKGVGSANVVPIVNMADEPSLVDQARAVAAAALERTLRFDAVVLASMEAEDPIVAVVRR